MNENTINADMTIGVSTNLLSGRYRVIRQLGQGGDGFGLVSRRYKVG